MVGAIQLQDMYWVARSGDIVVPLALSGRRLEDLFYIVGVSEERAFEWDMRDRVPIVREMGE